MIINKKKRLVNEITTLLKLKGVTVNSVLISYFHSQSLEWLNNGLQILRQANNENIISGIFALAFNLGAIPNDNYLEKNEKLLKEFLLKRGIVTSEGKMISNIALQVVDLSKLLQDLNWLDLFFVADRLAVMFKENVARLN